jgi:hypothetical protein
VTDKTRQPARDPQDLERQPDGAWRWVIDRYSIA